MGELVCGKKQQQLYFVSFLSSGITCTTNTVALLFPLQFKQAALHRVKTLELNKSWQKKKKNNCPLKYIIKLSLLYAVPPN